MTAAPRHPVLTEERALHVAAFSALIDANLFDPEELLPARAAQNLLARLSHTGIAQVCSTTDGLRMSMFGITATSSGTATSSVSVYGLFRAWQEAARTRIEAGVQR